MSSTTRPAEEHADVLADLGDDAEVVRDEEKRRAVTRLHLRDQAENLLLHRHVEGRRRLVRHDELRLGREGGRDQDALAHAAGELVRIAGQHALRIADMHLGEKLERALARVAAPKGRGSRSGGR